jgi:hypothetical protein
MCPSLGKYFWYHIAFTSICEELLSTEADMWSKTFPNTGTVGKSYSHLLIDYPDEDELRVYREYRRN